MSASSRTSDPSSSCITRIDWNKLILSESVEFDWSETALFVTVFCKFLQWQGWLCYYKIEWLKLANLLQQKKFFLTYWTSSMTHSNVAFDIESGRSGESECFHICINLSLEYSAVGPWTSEAWDQFVINRTAKFIYELDSLCCSIMRITMNFIFQFWAKGKIKNYN